MKKSFLTMAILTLAIIIATNALAQPLLSDLKEGQKLASFTTEAVYLNDAGKVIGARFRHTPSHFVLDLLRIQSLPQAFTWVNSPPPSDQGEPHTCEHLLLGKGTVGRYVASLEEMSLGRSSAYTEQTRTCYHFNTSAGTETFFNLFEKKLNAMINPSFSDEEIRREVCNIGIRTDRETGALSLEEKGTVYNEMVSSFERPWGNLYFRLGKMLFGEGHYLARSAGGFPADIRTMTPADLRNFHSSTHHLNNMGAVACLPDDITLVECLERISKILTKVEPYATAGDDPAALYDRLPKAKSEPVGLIETVTFPHQNENEPGLLVYAWPPVQDLSTNELYLLELLMDNLASGQTSNLYDKFINSQTSVMDVGASSVFSWVSEEPGTPIYLGFSSINPKMLTEDMIDSIRGLVIKELNNIANWSAVSEELASFNERAKNRIISRRRDLKKFLNSPPRFGTRGTGSSWIDHLQRLNKDGGFKRNLMAEHELAFAESKLAASGNIWTDFINKWQLAKILPYAVGTRPDPTSLAKSETARQERLANYGAQLIKKYGASNLDEAIKQYAAEYDFKTKIIDDEAATIQMPSFVENPPLSIDDLLNFRTEKMTGGGDLIVSTFDNITSTSTGLAFNLKALPEEMLIFVPALPTLLTDIGVVRDGTPILFDEVTERMRQEILGFKAYFDVNYRTQRSELVIRAAGGDESESAKALDWLETVLYHSFLQPENLPRIKDAINLELKYSRNRMSRSEESWVNTPANAYWRQNNPLLLSADCFLTQGHSLYRLKWMLTDAKSAEAKQEFDKFITTLRTEAATVDRETLSGKLDSYSIEGNELIAQAVDDLKAALAEIPDGSFNSDFSYLCDEMQYDLSVKPVDALTQINKALDLLRKQDNVRGFMTASSANQKVLIPRLNKIVDELSTEPTTLQTYSSQPRVLTRVKERSPAAKEGKPFFVGLVNESTRAGVHINSAPLASFEEQSEDKLLDFLAARLYGGGGAHSMFMKTWGAGLAYSNGLRSNEYTGRLTYYAERCPDLAQTMEFVVDQLENAPYDASLANYAVSQAFAVIRSGSTYEQRGEAMAADLADSLTPDDVRRFRYEIMQLAQSEGLYDKLHQRMASVYGKVLPGYGPSCAEEGKNNDAFSFVIGPSSQFESFQSYLNQVEPGAEIMKIYPRDYWLVGEKH